MHEVEIKKMVEIKMINIFYFCISVCISIKTWTGKVASETRGWDKMTSTLSVMFSIKKL